MIFAQYAWHKSVIDVVKSQGKLKDRKEFVIHKQKDTSKQTSSIKIAILKMFYWSKLSKQTKEIEENEESKQTTNKTNEMSKTTKPSKISKMTKGVKSAKRKISKMSKYE